MLTGASFRASGTLTFTAAAIVLSPIVLFRKSHTISPKEFPFRNCAREIALLVFFRVVVVSEEGLGGSGCSQERLLSAPTPHDPSEPKRWATHASGTRENAKHVPISGAATRHEQQDSRRGVIPSPRLFDAHL